MSRRPLTVFFALAFVLPWSVWGTALAEQAGWTSWHVPAPLAFWLGLPIASFGAAALTGGRAAVVDLLRRMVRVRVGAGWYALALLTTPVLLLVTAGVVWLVGRPLEAAFAGPGQLVGLLAFNAWMWLLTEETAWRGFALPRMIPRFGAVTASLLLGVIWALWHLPLFALAGSFQAQLPFAAFALSTIASSMLIGWLFDGSGGSVVIAALFHASADVGIGLSGVMTSGAGSLWVFVCLQLVAAGVATWWLGSRRRRPADSIEPCIVPPRFN